MRPTRRPPPQAHSMPWRPLQILVALWTVLAVAAPVCGAEAPAALVVASVELAGLANVKESVARDAVKLKPGDAYSPERMEADRRSLMALGFFRSCTASQRSQEGKAFVTYRLSEWPVV